MVILKYRGFISPHSILVIFSMFEIREANETNYYSFKKF